MRFLRDRLLFSFKKITKRNSVFVLEEPIPPVGNPVFCPEFNLWSRALAFYAAGKIMDAHPLGGILQDYRQSQVWRASRSPSIRDAQANVWDSLQLHRLFSVLNRNRLECERASTTLVVHALEFIIKAICVHCNHHLKGVFFFPNGHDLYDLYASLPSCCRGEIEEESGVFFRTYYAERMNAEEAVKSLAASSSELKPRTPGAHDAALNGIQKTATIVANKKYLDLRNNEPLSRKTMPTMEWLSDALKGAGSLINHRYGPTPNRIGESVSVVDPYSAQKIEDAQKVARFFLEHLFGVDTPTDISADSGSSLDCIRITLCASAERSPEHSIGSAKKSN